MKFEKIYTSKNKHVIDNMLNDGKSVREIERTLKRLGEPISKSAIHDYSKSFKKEENTQNDELPAIVIEKPSEAFKEELQEAEKIDIKEGEEQEAIKMLFRETLSATIEGMIHYRKFKDMFPTDEFSGLKTALSAVKEIGGIEAEEEGDALDKLLKDLK